MIGMSSTDSNTMDAELTQVSKFLSYVLRHRPDAIGLALDAHGWAWVSELIEKALNAGTTLDMDRIHRAVETNDKKRFALSDDGLRIRANQGHSVSVDLGLVPAEPPPMLYHGTATRFLESILAKGLVPGTRQHVHLSLDSETATKVGARHGDPVILRIAAQAMYAQGFLFYCAENGVWLTGSVDPQFLSVEGTFCTSTDSANTSRHPNESR